MSSMLRQKNGQLVDADQRYTRASLQFGRGRTISRTKLEKGLGLMVELHREENMGMSPS